MQLLSLNVGKSRDLSWQGKVMTSAILKEPTTKRLRVSKLQINGDQQADLSVHGGIDKAVYSYASEYYPLWKEELGRNDLPFGMFGENLTTQGLKEAEIFLGDQIRVGSVLLEAVQPRFPCSKLGARFQDDSIIRKFMQSGRLGIYYRVLEEGELAAGDAIMLETRHADSLPVGEIARLKVNRKDRDGIQRLIEVPYLLDSWREYFTEYLD